MRKSFVEFAELGVGLLMESPEGDLQAQDDD